MRSALEPVLGTVLSTSLVIEFLRQAIAIIVIKKNRAMWYIFFMMDIV